jgi:hypothetical protein
MKILFAAFIALFIFGGSSRSFAQASPEMYFSEALAHNHCPHDTVVWFDYATSHYHFKSEHWYGKTDNGMYVCQKDADKSGAHSSRDKP